MSSTSVFFLGATGYIGGSVLVDLKKAFPDISITATTRSNSSAAALSAAGTTPVALDPAAPDYHEKITDFSSKADIVINAADCDDLPLTEAILKGLKKRKEETGKVSTLFHTSGIAVFFDDTKDGTYKPDGHFHDDSNEDDIKAITPQMMHGHVDVPILKAGQEGYVNTYIVCPGGVNGAGWGPVSKVTIYVKYVVGTILQQKTAIKIGEGSNVFGFVHIKDLTSFYVELFRSVLKLDGKAVGGSPYTRYYIISKENVAFKSIQEGIASELFKRGLLPSKNLATKSFEELGPLAKLVAANTLLKPERARQDFGWEPKHPLIVETIAEDVDVALPALGLA
ncbi:NAD(P)-binding protein [Schizopora paradoxa]|uniref:NAD(P)-binding protein n=1 Tax=Schizopora paradoxa TaxID=27342 RepID=A0A0H2RJJ5_9AGAM|nr:NAD(P)-binding protein [Schizopora paradoxa]